ncbi:MAG: response regulator transcription factor [Sporichthyaceae bacterium]|nr:response regulator transcription factor [Sporichthyaceae bacterium]
MVEPPGRTKIRVLIADDHEVVRRGLRTFLEVQDDIDIVGEAANGEVAVQQAQALQPDVILLDLKMPGVDGVEALRMLRAREVAAKVLVVTSYADLTAVVPAVRAGAAGYVYKDIDPDALANAIRSIHAGHVLLHPEVAAALLTAAPGSGRSGAGDGLSALTPRERDVLAEIARGRSNREIARALVLSEKTVKTHVSNILMKLDLADRTQAALFAVRHGIGDAG